MEKISERDKLVEAVAKNGLIADSTVCQFWRIVLSEALAASHNSANCTINEQTKEVTTANETPDFFKCLAAGWSYGGRVTIRVKFTPISVKNGGKVGAKTYYSGSIEGKPFEVLTGTQILQRLFNADTLKEYSHKRREAAPTVYSIKDEATRDATAEKWFAEGQILLTRFNELLTNHGGVEYDFSEAENAYRKAVFASAEVEYQKVLKKKKEKAKEDATKKAQNIFNGLNAAEIAALKALLRD